jgi:hypothetical protein
MTDAEVFDNVTRPLHHLLTFACDAPCQLLRLSYGSSAYKKQLTPNISMLNQISAIHMGDKPHQDEKHDLFLLFVLPDVRAYFESLVTRWFELWGQLSPALDLLFGTQLGRETYLETRFLLLAQAAEVYSRLRFPDQQRQNKDHKARRKHVIATIADPDDRARLKEALAYFHEPTFREKLAGLLAHAGDQANAVRRDEFPNAVKSTRNYFTHYDD